MLSSLTLEEPCLNIRLSRLSHMETTFSFHSTTHFLVFLIGRILVSSRNLRLYFLVSHASRDVQWDISRSHWMVSPRICIKGGCFHYQSLFLTLHPFPLLPAWNADVLAGAPAAILRASRWGALSSGWPSSNLGPWVPSDSVKLTPSEAPDFLQLKFLGRRNTKPYLFEALHCLYHAAERNPEWWI